MSRKRLGRSLVEILCQLGFPLREEDVVRIQAAKEATPGAATEDIIVDLNLVPKAAVARAVVIAKREGSCEVLEDRIRKARQSIAAASCASKQLERVASRIAKK